MRYVHLNGCFYAFYPFYRSYMKFTYNPYNLAIVNLDPLNDYTSTREQEVRVLSLGWGCIMLFIYLFI